MDKILYRNGSGELVDSTWEYFRKEELEKNGYKYHHTSYAVGYQSVKHDKADRYSGRYGIGWKISMNNPKSTRFKFVAYYTKDKKERCNKIV